MRTRRPRRNSPAMPVDHAARDARAGACSGTARTSPRRRAREHLLGGDVRRDAVAAHVVDAAAPARARRAAPAADRCRARVSRISRRSSAVSRAARAARRSACRRQPSGGSSAPSRAKRSRSLPSVADRGLGRRARGRPARPRRASARPRRRSARRPARRRGGRAAAPARSTTRRTARAGGTSASTCGSSLPAIQTMPGALAHELAHARVLPGGAPVERVLGAPAARGRA